MRTRSSALISALLLSAAVFSSSITLAQPLPTDERLVTGELENGLKYVIRKHNNPPGRASAWVHLDTGSLNETDKQRGIAHYLEHMAFNGSEHFPPGSVVPFFQELGMTFGRDQNAFTSFDQTTYQLSLPDTRPETLGKGMDFLSDVVTKLNLSPKEIDSERGIIQEERRRGLGPQQRVGYYVLEKLTEGSLFGKRIPIGTEETINGVTEKDFRDYYGTYYTASNATVIVVADADPADVVKVIKEKFGPAAKKDRPTAQDVGLKVPTQPRAVVASDAELTTADVQITRIAQPRGAATTIPQMRVELMESLGEQAFNRRVKDKIDAGGMALLRASVRMGDQAQAVRMCLLSAQADKPENWKLALDQAALELQRARKFGFTNDEIEEGKARMMKAAERGVETEGTMPSRVIIQQINGALARRAPIMSAAQRLDLLKEVLPTISKEDVSAYFQTEMEPGNAVIVGTFPTSIEVPTEATLLDLATKALSVPPTQDAEAKYATKLMDELPKAGTVAETKVHEATGVATAWLSNNVLVHHRFMDYRKNQVTVSISLIGGELLESAENHGVSDAAAIAFGHPATSKLTSTDISHLTAKTKVNVGGGAGATGLRLLVTGSPEELEQGMQLAYLLLTDPKIEKPAFDQWITAVIEGTEASYKVADSYGPRLLAQTRFPKGEVRPQPLTVEEIKKLDLASAQAWLTRQVKTSPIEVTIVGDISRDKAMDLAAKYLGALPGRERVTPQTLASHRMIQKAKGPHIASEAIDSKTAKAWVWSGFYGPDATNVEDSRALAMAARILSTRMVKQVREEAQLVYSIGAGFSAGSTYPGFGAFSATAPTQPTKVKALVAKLTEMFDAFAKDGCTAEELTVAKKQFEETYKDTMREPSHWQAELDEIVFDGRNLDEVLKEPEAMQKITAAQVQAAFKKYYSPENAIVVSVTPKGEEAPKK